jgi:hypothetical protein
MIKASKFKSKRHLNENLEEIQWAYKRKEEEKIKQIISWD